MTKWLASVQSLSEAQSLANVLPDILDMKNPSQGALGALSCQQVAEIVDWVNGRCLTSATVGDLPMQPGVISAAIERMASTGVDFVKVGLFADQNLQECIRGIQPSLAQLKTPVIAVLFADEFEHGVEKLILLLNQVGFAGVMVDTATKDGKNLLDHWSQTQLIQFVALAKQQNLFCGLAGALTIDAIDNLDNLGADYLGFRSALCVQLQRTASLQPALAREIQHRLQRKTKTALAS